MGLPAPTNQPTLLNIVHTGNLATFTISFSPLPIRFFATSPFAISFSSLPFHHQFFSLPLPFRHTLSPLPSTHVNKRIWPAILSLPMNPHLRSHSYCHSISQDIHTLEHIDPGLLSKLEVVGSIEPCLSGTPS